MSSSHYEIHICNQIRLLSHIIVEIKYSSSICTIIELSTSVNMNRVGKLCSVGMFKAFLRAKLRIGLPATDIWGRTGSFVTFAQLQAKM